MWLGRIEWLQWVRLSLSKIASFACLSSRGGCRREQQIIPVRECAAGTGLCRRRFLAEQAHAVRAAWQHASRLLSSIASCSCSVSCQEKSGNRSFVVVTSRCCYEQYSRGLPLACPCNDVYNESLNRDGPPQNLIFSGGGETSKSCSRQCFRRRRTTPGLIRLQRRALLACNNL